MRMKVAALSAAGLVVGSLLQCLPAAANPCDGSINAGLDSVVGDMTCPKPPETDDPPEPGKKRTGGKSVTPACVWVPEPGYQPGAGQKADGDGGHWYRKFCRFGDYQTLADLQREMGTWDVMNMQRSNMMQQAGLDTRWFTTPPPAPIPTPQQLMASIVGELPVPKTFIAVNPVAAKQIVGLPTWVWLTDEQGRFVPDLYKPKPKRIGEYGYQMEWQVVPQITLSPGDGGIKQTCDTAGVPWSAASEGDPGACTVTFEKSGQYTLTATVAWTVQWTLFGTPQPDVAGPTNTATRAVTVLEVQALTR